MAGVIDVVGWKIYYKQKSPTDEMGWRLKESAYDGRKPAKSERHKAFEVVLGRWIFFTKWSGQKDLSSIDQWRRP